MTWQTNRPIYHRLPSDSENWQGNQVVDWLTGYWDDLITSHKTALTEPTDWLGDPISEMSDYYLDWVGLALCGFGDSWNFNWSEEAKRRVIRSWNRILPNRTSRESLSVLADAILPGSRVVSYHLPRANFARSDASWVGNDEPMLYHVYVPKSTNRNDVIWMQLESLITSFFPIGSRWVRVQYDVAMADFAVAGDSVTSFRSFESQPTN